MWRLQVNLFSNFGVWVVFSDMFLLDTRRLLFSSVSNYFFMIYFFSLAQSCIKIAKIIKFSLTKSSNYVGSVLYLHKRTKDRLTYYPRNRNSNKLLYFKNYNYFRFYYHYVHILPFRYQLEQSLLKKNMMIRKQNI